MHDDSQSILGRVDRFARQTLAPNVRRSSAPLEVQRWEVHGEPVPFAVAARQHYLHASIGDSWGCPWDTTWFRVRGAVPPEWSDANVRNGSTEVEVQVDLGFGRRPGFQAEALAYRVDGTIIKGISPRNSWVPISASNLIDFYIEAASNPDVTLDYSFAPTGLGAKETAGDEHLYTLREVSVVLRDRTVWELQQDVAVLRGLVDEIDERSPRRAQILRALNRTVDVVDPDDVAGTAAAGRGQLREVLSAPAARSAHRLIAVGHAHIDSAWLWPIRETVRKCARTFSNVLALAEEYPDFTFACSSAQQLLWVKEGYPELYERIRDAVRRGQFVPVGGMWVESDTNMPGGEALVRQFLEGRDFFSTEFGVEPREVWLPDSFGYSGNLPQIARGAGAEFFLSQKMSWNQTNKMPHHTFQWEGIDGTRIYTHFPPVDTYNAQLSAAELAHAERNYRENGRGSMSLVPFGWGDGGGGPTREMVAAAHRTKSLEGSPRVEMNSPENFFERARAEYPDPAVWSGEMYLELHRGTYTSQLRTKQGNRRSEHLLREAELWATTAAVRTGWAYPHDELRKLWQNVLVLQFHDILPGSSIAWVHRDAERNYDAIARRAESIIDGSLRELVGAGGSLQLMVNSRPEQASGVPPLGIGRGITDGRVARVVEDEFGFVLSNHQLAVRVDRRGLITSLSDVASGREAIAPGQAANLLQLHRDIPNQWDAWDIDAHFTRVHTDLVGAATIRAERDHSGAHLTIDRSFGKSAVSQRLTLHNEARALTITSDIDWHERGKILKLSFPLDVHADRVAAETQFGHIYRPTHTNTSWDDARFETCAHRWIHAGEPNYGVAVANDSTYGYDATSSPREGGGRCTTLRLSLVRAPRYPDPDSDQGRHRITVSVTPGASISDAIEEGFRLNLPLRNITGSRPIEPLLTVDNPAVKVEAIKLAHDGSGDVIARLYEALGTHVSTSVTPRFPFHDVRKVDLLERVDDNETASPSTTWELRPFQILTLRIRRK